MRTAALLAHCLLLPTVALGQTGAANLNPMGGLNQSPAITNGFPYGPFVPYVNAATYGPFGPGYQSVPMYWWLDPGYVWNPYNIYGYAGVRTYTLPSYIPSPLEVMPPTAFAPPGYFNYGMIQPQGAPPTASGPAANPGKQEEKAKAARPKDNLDQQAVMHRELLAGNQALAAGQNTAALKRYEAAAQAQPLDAAPLFHQAQAHLALGQYGKAATAVQRGLKWRPDWPLADFSPRAIYGDRTSAFDQNLAQLAQAIERNPNDDSLLFLLGYELWFDGKKDQARTVFKRAASLASDRTAIDRFLK